MRQIDDKAKDKKLEEVEPLYDVDDIARIFKCSTKKARAIMSQNNFPVMMVGREPRVVPSKLKRWLEQYYNKQVKAT